jgi:hypothetical protein
MAKLIPATPDQTENCRDRFEQGKRLFSLLFTRWMDTNGWSHPVMVNLATSCLQLPDKKGWLHSSQISGLRHAGLSSPGPRTFIAIERLNYYVHRYATKKTLLPGTSSSNFYAKAYAITENGAPPSIGWWVEVFCGDRVPKDIELRDQFFTDEQAGKLSSNWGALIRRLMIQQGHDIITELDKLVRDHYPAKDTERVDQLLAVIQNRSTWTPDQLALELPAISSLTADMGGPADEQALLSELRG